MSNDKIYNRIIKVIVGSFLQAITLVIFMRPAQIIPGGFAGLSLLIQRIFQEYQHVNIPYSVLLIVLNLIPAVYAFFNLGKKFVSLSVLAVLTSGILVDVIHIEPLTDDIFLNVVFAAILYGTGASIILNSNACTGGTDFIALAVANKTNKNTWNYVLVFNAIIYVIYGVLFGFQMALYSIIFQVIYTAMINAGQIRYQRRTAFIVTPNPEPLADELMALTNHGVTVLKGKGQYSGEERYLLYMVIEKKDVKIIQNHIKKNYPQNEVFLNITDSEQLLGKFVLDPID